MTIRFFGKFKKPGLSKFQELRNKNYVFEILKNIRNGTS